MANNDTVTCLACNGEKGFPDTARGPGGKCRLCNGTGMITQDEHDSIMAEVLYFGRGWRDNVQQETP